MAEINGYVHLKPGNRHQLDDPDFFHRIPVKDSRAMLKVDNEDHNIVKGVCLNKNKTMGTITHCMIGQSVKCWQENHEEVINRLATEVIELTHIVGLYRERFGKLRVVKKGEQEQEE